MKKHWEIVNRSNETRKKYGDKIQNGSLNWMLEQKEDIGGKTGEINIKPKIYLIVMYNISLIVLTNEP